MRQVRQGARKGHMTNAYKMFFGKSQGEAQVGVLDVDTKCRSHTQQILHHIQINFQTPVCRSIILNRSSMVFQSIKTNTRIVPQHNHYMPHFYNSLFTNHSTIQHYII